MKEETTLPRARTLGLIVEGLEDELLVYDLKRQKSHCLNRAAAQIWERCDGRTSADEMARAISRDAGTGEGGKGMSEEAVWVGLRQLAGAHLLEGKLRVPAGAAKVTRRELVKRAAAVAVSVPVILTITAPTAKAQASCLPRDSACTLNSQCCSGNCRGNGLCA